MHQIHTPDPHRFLDCAPISHRSAEHTAMRPSAAAAAAAAARAPRAASGYDAELAASLQEQEYEEEGQGAGGGGGGGGLAAALQAQEYEDDVPSHPHFGPAAGSIFHRSPCECICTPDQKCMSTGLPMLPYVRTPMHAHAPCAVLPPEHGGFFS